MRQLELDALVQGLDDLPFFRSFAFVLFLVCEIVFNHVAKIGKRLSSNQFIRKGIIKNWQYFLLNLTDAYVVTCLLSRQFLHRKICRKIDRHLAGLAVLLTSP